MQCSFFFLCSPTASNYFFFPMECSWSCQKCHGSRPWWGRFTQCSSRVRNKKVIQRPEEMFLPHVPPALEFAFLSVQASVAGTSRSSQQENRYYRYYSYYLFFTRCCSTLDTQQPHVLLIPCPCLSKVAPKILAGKGKGLVRVNAKGSRLASICAPQQEKHPSVNILLQAAGTNHC